MPHVDQFLLQLYTLSSKNQAALKFVKTAFLTMSATAAIIIWVICNCAIFVHSWRFCVFHSLWSFMTDVYRCINQIHRYVCLIWSYTSLILWRVLLPFSCQGLILWMQQVIICIHL
jgi:hypothetical protein